MPNNWTPWEIAEEAPLISGATGIVDWANETACCGPLWCDHTWWRVTYLRLAGEGHRYMRHCKYCGLRRIEKYTSQFETAPQIEYKWK